METFWNTISELEKVLENQATGIPKWQLIAGTALITSGTLYLSRVVQNREDTEIYLKQTFFNIIKKIPSVKQKIKEEVGKLESDILDSMFEPEEASYETFLQLPEKGKSTEEVLEIAKNIISMGRYDWKSGKVSGGVMTGTNDELTDLMLKMHSTFSWSNPLHIDVFPGVQKMDCEVVQMTAKLFHGDNNTIGCMTSGGSESLLLVMKAYRDWSRAVKGIEHPEVIAPDTVHSGIDKGAKILGYKFRRVKTDPKTVKFEISDFEKLINKNTALLVGSAPDFAHGVVDDIQALSRLATKYGIPLHVDCCLGGYFLPFKSAAGYPTPLFDFRLSGVTSISADTHKYGLAPKGSSVVLYSKKDYFHYQYFTVTDWPGGVYATPTIPGSRSGVNIAMCWAALLYNGFSGYVENTRKIVEVSYKLRQEIRKMKDLFIFGDPVGPIVSFGSDTFNILHVADIMAEFGWHLQALQNPPGVHIYLTSLHTTEDFVEKFVGDLKTAVEKAKSDTSKKEHWAKIYGMTKSVPDETIVEDFVKIYLDGYYTSAKEL